MDPYLQSRSVVHWDLRECGLTLLNVLLVHCFQSTTAATVGGSGRLVSNEARRLQNQNVSNKGLVHDLEDLLDSAMNDDDVSTLCLYPGVDRVFLLHRPLKLKLPL